jgi:hypothetical protein
MSWSSVIEKDRGFKFNNTEGEYRNVFTTSRYPQLGAQTFASIIRGNINDWWQLIAVDFQLRLYKPIISTGLTEDTDLFPRNI